MDNLQFNNENPNTNATKPNQQQLIKYGVIAGCAVVALIIVVALFSAIFGSSYKTPIKKAVALINDKTEDAAPYIEYSSLDTEYAFYQLHREAVDYDDESYESYIEELEEEYGDNFKVKYKIDDADKLKESKLEDLQEEFEDAYKDIEDEEDDTLDMYEELWDEADVSSKDQKKLEKAFEKFMKECGKVKVTAAYEVDLECTIKGSEDDDEFKIKNLVIAKVNGQWIFVEGSVTPSTVYGKVMSE